MSGIRLTAVVTFADRHEDIYAACEQLMPEGDVIYGDVKEIQEENRSACACGGDICY